MNKLEQAIILAAGSSQRLKSLTSDKPKSFLEINGTKIIERHLDFLSKVGIKKVLIVVGFMKEKFKTLIGNSYNDLEICYIDCDEYYKWNHSWSFFLTREVIEQSNQNLIIVHADTYYEFETLKKLVSFNCNDVVLADPDFKIKTNDELLVYGQDGFVRNIDAIDNKGDRIIGEFIGLHKMSLLFFTEFCNFLDAFFVENDKKQGYDKLLGLFVNYSDIKLQYLEIFENWVNINYKEDYLQAKKIGESSK